MDEERRDDDMTSYLKRSENSLRVSWWFCTEVTTILKNWKVDTFSIIDIIMDIAVIRGKVRVGKSSRARPRIMKDARALALEGRGTCSGGFAYSSRIYQRNAL